MALKLASIYIAAVIGAGFASGQEINQFFVRFGQTGLIGIAIATLLLAVGGVGVLLFARQHNLRSYEHLLALLGGSTRHLLDLLYTGFLLAGFSIMIAGSNEVLGFGRYLTSLIIFLALIGGPDKVLLISSYAIPLLLGLMSVVAGTSLIQTGISMPSGVFIEGIGSGILYGSYNLGFAIAVFAGLGRKIACTREAILGGILGAIGLGLLVLLQTLALYSQPQVTDGSLPMLEMAKAASPTLGMGYGVILWVAMYTTALANGLALVTRLDGQTTLTWTQSTVLVVCLGLLISHVGFVPLIRTAYPIFGYVGLYLIYRILTQK